MTNTHTAKSVRLEKESDGLWFTPEGDYCIQRSESEGAFVFYLYPRANGEIVEPKYGPDGFDSLADARHDIALMRNFRAGLKPANGSDGPSKLSEMFRIR